MKKHLYIIGNGFDLHHGINSSYGNFQEWLTETNPTLIDNINEVYGYCDADWWSDFENQLASLDAIRYGREIAFENQPDLVSDHCDRTWNDAEIAVKQQLEELYWDLRKCFHEWIMQLNTPLELKKIKLIISDAVFLNFNYTKTLENLYGIKSHNILHIHGCIDEDEDFILGHGKSYEELRRLNTPDLPEPPEDLSNEELSQFYEERTDDGHMLHEQLAEDAAIDGVASQKKPVENLIKKHEDFFNSLVGITYIHIYGMSLSDVDKPYLCHIASIVKHAHWEFSDYKGNDINKIKAFCKANNIRNYNIIDLNDIIDSNQLKIPFPPLPNL